MAAAMRGCEYEYVAERGRGLQTVARTSSYRYRYALPLCVLNGGFGLFFNPAPALTEPTPKIIGAHMAEISIQEIEAPAHASAIATGGHGPFSACGELYARNRKGAESKARFSISIAISDCDIAQKMLRVQTKVENVVCAESFMSGIGTDRLRSGAETPDRSCNRNRTADFLV